MIDEDLLHRVIDGEATLEETRRLEEALRLDATARERSTRFRASTPPPGSCRR
jgi:anti-sigma factor RsiW